MLLQTPGTVYLEENSEMQWKAIYKLGAACAFIVLAGTITDIIIGSSTGGDLSVLPQSAAGRFEQLQSNLLYGLYNLDLLNIIIQIIMLPVYFAFYAVHRKTKPAFSAFALLVFITGTIIFVSNNAALEMLELSNKYAASSDETQRLLFAAAGEAELAKGAHGSLGAFISYILPLAAGIIISFVMLKGKVFNRTISILGIASNTILLIYILIVTFIPAVKNDATAFAAPGGLLFMAWMIMSALRLLRLGRKQMPGENP